MKFDVNVKVLKAEASILRNIAESKSGVPILSNVLIESIGTDKIKLTASNLDTILITEVPATIKTEGAFCISCKKLVDIIKGLDDGTMKFAVEANNWVKITCNTAKYRVAGVGKNQFPESPIIEKDEIALDSDVLKKLIDYTCYAITQEESRFALSGAKFVLKEGTITMAASDGNRVAIAKSYIDDQESAMDMLIPKKGLTEAVRFATNTVSISENDSFIKFRSGKRILFSRKLTGLFPNYEMAIPKDNNITVKFDAKEFSKALERVANMADEDNKAIKITIEENRMLLFANSSGEESEDIVLCKATELPEEGFSIYLNWKYMKDFIALCSKPTLFLKNANTQAQFVDGSAMCICMPLRFN